MLIKIRELINTPCSILNETVRFDSQGIGEITKEQHEHLLSAPYFKLVEVLEPQSDNPPIVTDKPETDGEDSEPVKTEDESESDGSQVEEVKTEEDSEPAKTEEEAQEEKKPKNKGGRPRHKSV